MNKIAFYGGYMTKTAAGVGAGAAAAGAATKAAAGSEVAKLLAKLVKYPLLIGGPGIAGYYGGKLYSDVFEPSSKEVSVLQSEYVKKKLEQAVEELETKRKIENMEAAHGNTGDTLRI
jgi:hypothetical protein